MTLRILKLIEFELVKLKYGNIFTNSINFNAEFPTLEVYLVKVDIRIGIFFLHWK